MGNFTSKHDEHWVKCLVDQGCDQYLLDNGANPTLHLSRTTNIKIIKMLLGHGADPNKIYIDDECPVLLKHIYYKNFEIVKLLLEYGANPNVCTNNPDNDNGEGIMYAIHTSLTFYPKILPLLVEKGADINKCMITNDGVTLSVIDCALLTENKKIINFFLKKRVRMSGSAIALLYDKYPLLYKKWVNSKWIIIKCIIKFLSLHQRAVISANHPLKKLKRNEFEIII